MLPNGDAATLPVVPPTRSSAIDELPVEQLARRVWMIGIAGAATFVAAVTAIWSRPTELTSLQAAARALPRRAPPVDIAVADSAVADVAETTNAAPSSRETLMERLSPWPLVTFAQSRGATRRNAAYLGLVALDASRLKPGRRRYLRSGVHITHELLPYTTYTVELDSAVLHKRRTWCLVTVTPTSTGLAANNERDAQYDTVRLRRSDLRPVRRSHDAGFLRLRQTFTDSVLVETDSLIAPAGKTLRDGMKLRPFRNRALRRLDARVPFVPTEETMRILLRAAPLHERWRATVGALAGDNRTFALSELEYLNLRVDGTRDVHTLSGRFATWRVVLETGPKPEVWYVSKETGETLLTEGSWGVAYPVSETRLLYGCEETKRRPPVGSR